MTAATSRREYELVMLTSEAHASSFRQLWHRPLADCRDSRIVRITEKAVPITRLLNVVSDW